MTEPSTGRSRSLPHLIVPYRGTDVAYRGRGGGGSKKLHAIGDRAGHAQKLTDELAEARHLAAERAADLPREIRPEGFPLCVEGWNDEPSYDLALSSLGADGAMLLAVLPADATRAERALVWMPFGAEAKFLRKLNEFAHEDTRHGKPKNQALVANIQALRLAILREFWQDGDPFPADSQERWWEVWFTTSPTRGDEIAAAVAGLDLRMASQTLTFPERTIALIRATPERLSGLLSTNCVVAEVHRPPAPAEFIDVDGSGFGRELVADLAERIDPADERAPVVCLLDTGLNARHRLLRDSVDLELTALRGTTPADDNGHGTMMAGLALFDDLPSALAGSDKIELRHRLESVKILQQPETHPLNSEPPFYGVVAASAVSLAELAQPDRRRVFSTQITSQESTSDGRPTAWSASLDAVAFGTDVGVSPRGIALLGSPDPTAARLICVSAGNIWPYESRGDYLDECDTSPIQDPAQAWNVLTVGGYTGLTQIHDPMYRGSPVLAAEGELSPHTTTSLTWRSTWPLAPDIVMESGNLMMDASGQRWEHADLQLLTTRNNGSLAEAKATSAATAQAARLGALVLDRYPKLWPETVRGLLVHSAGWTPAMSARIMPKKLKKQERVQMLRRYGWGVPTKERLLASASDDVTLIVEDEFLPFEKGKGSVSMRALRLHELPWPRDLLFDLGETDVELRVTLSYFVEPNPSNKGWVRYRYPSHQLRFDLKRPTETPAAFQSRVARAAQEEEDNKSTRAKANPADVKWLIGPDGRSRGSLHADVWTGYAADLAECGRLAVVPVGGWWKDNKRTDRVDLPIRYALLVSLKSTVSTDIYTPIASQIGIETAIET